MGLIKPTFDRPGVSIFRPAVVKRRRFPLAPRGSAPARYILTKLKRQTLDDFLRKLHTTSSIERTAGSGRPQSSRTTDNIAAFEYTVELNC